ncbi:MAG: glycosyltransferase family 2 protein [Bryobacterales bacterium]
MTNAVAVVIVTYNSADEIGPCLDALRRHVLQGEGTGDGVDVVVVDNASSDATCEIVETRAPFARLIRNRSNRGFAGAVNQAVRVTTSPLVLLLNPDADLETGLGDLVRAFDSPEVGAAGGKLVGRSGEWQRGFNVRSFPTPAALLMEALLVNRVWARNPVNRRYRMLDFDPRRAQDVDQPAGAFLMFRREVWEKLDGLDEAFHPIWFEDVDLCWRIRESGARILFVPGAVARHEGGHSLRGASVRFRQLAWYGSFLRFCNKHFSGGAFQVLRAATAVGLCVRWCACWGAGSSNDRKAYSSALKMVMGSQAAHNVSANVGPAPIVES